MSSQDARQEALKLMDSKDAMEKELAELHAALQSQNADLGTSLFDNEGFPRADIDVHGARLTRVRVIELRNDLRDLSSRIKELLEIALAKPDTPVKTTSSEMEDEKSTPTPFALVNGVAPASPAHQTGLLRSDKIVRFGSINASNHDNLRAVAQEVQKNENRTVTIAVLRKDESSSEEKQVNLVLVPKVWSGRGLLGCHIVPMPQ